MVALSFWTRVIFGLLFFSVKGVWLSGGSAVREPTCQVRSCKSRGWTPGLGRSPGGGPGNPPQGSCLGIPWTGSSSWGRRVGHDWVTERSNTQQHHRGCVLNIELKVIFVTLSDCPSHIYKPERSLSQTLSNSRFGKCGHLNYMLCEP